MIDIGAVTRLTDAIVNDQNVPTNPSGAVLTITLPDGTTTTPTVNLTPTTTGLLTVDYKTTVKGLHQVGWSTTAPDTASGDVFKVRQYIAMLSIAEAMQHVNMTSPPKDGGNELRRFIMAATQVVENKVGIIVPRSFTDLIEGDGAGEGNRILIMPRRPVMAVTSVTSVWPAGPSWDSTQLDFDADSGLIWQKTQYPFWWGPWRVVYQCGNPDFPEDIEHAAREQLRHLWKTQRGAQAPAVLQGEEEFTATTGFSFSIPRRVLELLEPYMVPSS